MKIILRVAVILFLTASIVGCNNRKPTKTTTQHGEISVISPIKFKEKSKNAIVIDIRTPKEFADGHIEGAVNVNYFDKTFLDEITKYDKTKPIFMYCRSGNRTSSASKKVSNLGFENVYDLQGGIKNWAKNNQKIVK